MFHIALYHELDAPRVCPILMSYVSPVEAASRRRMPESQRWWKRVGSRLLGVRGMARPACPAAVSWAACSECSSSAKTYALDDLRNSLEIPAGVAGIMSIANKEMGGLEAGRGALAPPPPTLSQGVSVPCNSDEGLIADTHLE